MKDAVFAIARQYMYYFAAILKLTCVQNKQPMNGLLRVGMSWRVWKLAGIADSVNERENEWWIDELQTDWRKEYLAISGKYTIFVICIKT